MKKVKEENSTLITVGMRYNRVNTVQSRDGRGIRKTNCNVWTLIKRGRLKKAGQKRK